MSPSWPVGCALGVWAALLAAQPCWAGPKTVWAKVGGTAAAMEADLAACADASKSVVAHADASERSAAVTVYGGAGIAAGLVGELLAEAIDTPGARAHAVRACMFSRGYHAIALTPVEAAALTGEKVSADALAWVEQFYATPDFSGRLADATAPPFPEAASDPYAYGAVRLDPSSFAAAAGPVQSGGVLLSGAASHRRTGRLLRDVPVAQYYGGGRLPAGVILQQAVFQESDGEARTYWCGPFKGMFESAPTCIRGDGQGYLLVSPDGAKWIVTGLDLHADPGAADPDSFWLSPSDADLIGPMQFTLTLRKSAPAGVSVEAMVTRGDDTETIWLDKLPLGPDGAAVLPLWGRRLILRPGPSGVAVSLTTDGDGSGWPYVRVPD